MSIGREDFTGVGGDVEHPKPIAGDVTVKMPAQAYDELRKAKEVVPELKSAVTALSEENAVMIGENERLRQQALRIESTQKKEKEDLLNLIRDADEESLAVKVDWFDKLDNQWKYSPPAGLRYDPRVEDIDDVLTRVLLITKRGGRYKLTFTGKFGRKVVYRDSVDDTQPAAVVQQAQEKNSNLEGAVKALMESQRELISGFQAQLLAKENQNATLQKELFAMLINSQNKQSQPEVMTLVQSLLNQPKSDPLDALAKILPLVQALIPKPVASTGAENSLGLIEKAFSLAKELYSGGYQGGEDEGGEDKPQSMIGGIITELVKSVGPGLVKTLLPGQVPPQIPIAPTAAVENVKPAGKSKEEVQTEQLKKLADVVFSSTPEVAAGIVKASMGEEDIKAIKTMTANQLVSVLAGVDSRLNGQEAKVEAIKALL